VNLLTSGAIAAYHEEDIAGSFPGGVKLITHVHLVPRLNRHGNGESDVAVTHLGDAQIRSRLGQWLS
jgi:transposase